jgi:histidinol-phosphate aminotransferase
VSAALTLLLAAVLDRAFGEPRNAWHPVAWSDARRSHWGRGCCACRPVRHSLRGVWHGPLAVGGVTGLAWWCQQALDRFASPWWAAAVTSLLLKPSMSFRMLHDEVAAVEAALQQSLDAGRARVAMLCSRDVSTLDAHAVRETAIETLAENLNDAWVAPLFWFVVAGPARRLGLPRGQHAGCDVGLPRALGMGRQGGCAGRRPAGLAAGAFHRRTAVRPGVPLRMLGHEATQTPSPNSGWPMATMALRLGTSLGKPGVYRLNAEAPAPEAAAVARGAGACTASRCLGVRCGRCCVGRDEPSRGARVTPRSHGGPDAQGSAPHDFSTCAHPLGPCPGAWQAVREADARRYPDPHSTALRLRLAALQDVSPDRVLLAASASEFIQRITAAALALHDGPVVVPAQAYGDYAAAAQAWGRAVVVVGANMVGLAALRWCADPDSPCGQDQPTPANLDTVPTVLDRAYAPLRLNGSSPWSTDAVDGVFQLWTPNKALGLTGVRGAYAIAPRHAAGPLLTRLHALEPSWPLGAHAVAMLNAWCEPDTATWLAGSLPALVQARATLTAGLVQRGFAPRPGVAPFVCVRVPARWHTAAPALRQHGVAVRDCSSFGLPDHWRLNALPAASCTALWRVLDAVA